MDTGEYGYWGVWILMNRYWGEWILGIMDIWIQGNMYTGDYGY